MAVNELLRRSGGARRGGGRSRTVSGPESLNEVDEGPANTNSAAQNGLETIAMLGMVGDALPAELPAQIPGPNRRRFGGRGARGGAPVVQQTESE